MKICIPPDGVRFADTLDQAIFLKTLTVEMAHKERMLMLQSANNSVLSLTVTKIMLILIFLVKVTASDVSVVQQRRIILAIISVLLILHAGLNHQTLPYWSNVKSVPFV